jgi:hypothetical protein
VRHEHPITGLVVASALQTIAVGRALPIAVCIQTAGGSEDGLENRLCGFASHAATVRIGK